MISSTLERHREVKSLAQGLGLNSDPKAQALHHSTKRPPERSLKDLTDGKR